MSLQYYNILFDISFRNIYLGEMFTCYINANNDSSSACTDVFIKVRCSYTRTRPLKRHDSVPLFLLAQADLQTSSQRLSLSGADSEVKSTLAPGEGLDDVITHEVKELGTHMFVLRQFLCFPEIYLLSQNLYDCFQCLHNILYIVNFIAWCARSPTTHPQEKNSPSENSSSSK